MENMELKVIENKHTFGWNFDEVAAALDQATEQYVGLVVNDQNLADMEKTQREIAAMRTKITKFQRGVKTEMEKPYKSFETQIKDLLGRVEKVERPIKDQIDKYEANRRDEVAAQINKYANELAASMGLQERYLSQFVIAEKWTNRTQKWKDTEADVSMALSMLLDAQKRDIDAAFMRQQKEQMATILCETLSVGLINPVTFADIENRIDSLDLESLKANIEREVQKRRDWEERAKATVVPKPVEKAPEPTPIKAIGGKDAQFVLYGVTMEQVEMVANTLKSAGIEYKCAVKDSVAKAV